MNLAIDQDRTDPSPAVMRAGILTRAGHFEVRDTQRPEPAAHQVRIRLQGSGVCASNLPAFEGRPWFDYPLPPGELGHEGWGLVDAVGQDVDTLRVGDRVAVLSFHAYAEYDIADAEHVVKLPPALSEQPFPGEALGCLMNIFRRARIGADHTVAIVGIGFLGAGLIQLAKGAGARVIAVARREASLELARSLGADETVRAQDAGTGIAQIESLTDGALCARVIECTGTQDALDLASAACAFGGRLIVAGFHQDGPRRVDMQLWNWRGLDVINAHERDPRVCVRGMREAVAAVTRGDLDLTSLITHQFPLSRLTEALAAAQQRPAGFVKGIVTMEGDT